MRGAFPKASLRPDHNIHVKNVHTSCILQHTRTHRENFQTFGRTHDRSFDSCGGSTPLHPQKPFHICCMKSLQNSGNKQIGNFTRQYRCDIIPWLARKFIFFPEIIVYSKNALSGWFHIYFAYNVTYQTLLFTES